MRSKISVGWGIGLFRNFTWVILGYYFASVSLVLAALYFTLFTLKIDSVFLLLVIAGVPTVLMGMLMAALALEPLRSHFEQLERFTKETLHELNLPISTITANTSMLKKNTVDEKSLRRLERIEEATAMLRARHNELNYLIKKQMQVEQIELFALDTLLQTRVDFLSALYGRFEWSVAIEPTHIRADAMGLAKVIDNLIENAVKYSGASRRIEIVLQDAKLWITDFGVGMDEGVLLHIFDRYYQNDATMPGFGIGLHLVKRYCDRHRIGLHVKSIKEEGTTVVLNFKEVRV
ncbi:MAG: HAMP domain-containing histidine kinase [Campylobacterales bacterium]|nr:HAMP domain-containing histidine kinase [Campylobacterales bacterium]